MPVTPALAAACGTGTPERTFDGGPGGTGTDISLAANWSGDTAPVSGDDACIPEGFDTTLTGSNVTAGSLEIAEGASLEVQTGRTLTISGVATNPSQLDVNGSLAGVGTVTGSVVNNGMVKVGALEDPEDPLDITAGTLTVTGDYTQGAAGMLNVDWIDTGGVAGTDFDLLNVSGNAAVDGGLNVASVEGVFNTSAFEFLADTSGSNVTGTFDTPVGDNAPGYTLAATTAADGVSAVATAATVSIAGTVYEDANDNGVIDAGETDGVEGVEVFADFNANGTEDAAEVVVTDADGEYSFSPVEAGTYDVVIDDPSVVTSVQPNEGEPVVVAAAAVTGVDAAVTFAGAISGNIHNDIDNDSTIDATDDPGAAGVQVYIDSASGPEANDTFDEGEPEVVTDESGAYAFLQVPDGSFDIRVTAPEDGSVVTQPGAAAITSGAPDTDVDGLVEYAGSISGNVTYADADADGLESGVVVFIDRNGDGVPEIVEPGAGAGAYTFNSVPNGAIAVGAETAPQSFFDVTPQSQEVTLADGDPEVDIDFATYPVAVNGYRFVAGDGGVFNYGDAESYGSMGGQPLAKPVVGMANTPSGEGYYLVASDGGVFAFGDAVFVGSMGGQPLNSPIVGMAADPDGEGYWLVAADGGVFAFGAVYSGSMGGQPLNSPVAGMAPDVDGVGYRLVAADGGIFAFDAAFEGSRGGQPINSPVVGMASDPDGEGYWLVAADGGIFSYDAPFYGSAGSLKLNGPVVGMAAAPTGEGYHLVAKDGGVFSYPEGGIQFYGSTGSLTLNSPVVGMASL